MGDRAALDSIQHDSSFSDFGCYCFIFFRKKMVNTNMEIVKKIKDKLY